MNPYKCPVCGGELSACGSSYVCALHHTYDIAKQGYVNLASSKQSGGGDDREMCRARHEFHSRNYYGCLARKIASVCLEKDVRSVLDAGCGEGYYLRSIRALYRQKDVTGFSLCGIDLAKEAILLGARCEKPLPEEVRIRYAVAGIFEMPYFDSSFDCLLSVFAPIPAKEAARVLKKDGVMIVASPGEEHLEGLKAKIYDSVIPNEEASGAPDGFGLCETLRVKDRITVCGEDVISLFHMTPYFWKTSPEDAERLRGVETLTTDISFIVRVMRKI